MTTTEALPTLPTLVGTPRQVAWAQDIRLRAVEAVRHGVSQYGNHTDKERQEIEDLLMAAVARAVDARWWITHRNGLQDPEGVLYALGNEAEKERYREIGRAVVARLEAEDAARAAAPPTRTGGAELVAKLRENGWRVAQLAHRLGVHRSSIYRWLSGQRVPNARNLARLRVLAKSWEGWNPPK